MKEWTYSELAGILKDLNYSLLFGYWYAREIKIKVTFTYFYIIEYILAPFPKKLRKIASKYFLPSVIMVAVK